MKIAIFGMGYIGCVTAACFSKLGNQIIGVEIRKDKIEMLKEGRAPVEEKGLNDLISLAIHQKKLFFTSNAEKAIMNSDIGFVCVGTPSNFDGSIDLSAINRICSDICKILYEKNKKGYIIVIRSSVIPGTIEKLSELIKKKYNFIANKDFYFVENPEFLREGTAIKDFFNPPNIVIGADKSEIAKKISLLYKKIKAPIFITSIKVAEMIKYANNSFHALKVAFTNEIATICKKMDIDSKVLLKIFSNDHILNVSEYYLKPGFSYGGSCLPKDLAALNHKAREFKLDVPILKSISKSNKEHIKKAFELIVKETKKKSTKDVAIFGIAFKSGTDDIRGSPAVYLISKLIKKKFNIKLFDPIIKREQVYNIIKSYRKNIYDPVSETKNLKQVLPKICNLFSTLGELKNQKVIVVINSGPELEEILKDLKEDQVLIDLKGIINSKNIKAQYIRFC